MLKYIDLFSGMGGMRVGLEQALRALGNEGECVLSSEIKEAAIEVYEQNFGLDTMCGDIQQIDTKDIEDFDILLAGFPCQPFSLAGNMLGFEDTRGTMFFEIARILRDKRPNYFLLENVDSLVIHNLSKEDKKAGKTTGKTFDRILGVLEELGYHVTWEVIQASDYGVAQTRKRVYIVGCLDREISLKGFTRKELSFGEVQEHGKECVDSDFTRKLALYLRNNGLTYDYLYDRYIRDKRSKGKSLHSWNLGLRGEVSEVQRSLLEKMISLRKSQALAKAKGVVYKDGSGVTAEELGSIYGGDQLGSDLADLVSKRYLKTYEESGYTLYDLNGGRLSYEFTKFIDPGKACGTLVATEVTRLGVIDGNGVRRLTLIEGLRLSGYPDSYTFDIDYKKGMDLLGNTVAVNVIQMLCERMLSV